MSLLLRILGEPKTTTQVSATTWAGMTGWWGDATSIAGESIGPDTALKISAVYACVGLLSETIASLPLVIYRWLENEDGRERARNHPLYRTLHDQPNERQTAMEYIQMMMAHALLRGSGYSFIRPGPRGFADQLVPIHPEKVTQKELLTNGRIRYQIQDESGRIKPYNQEDVFEVGGLTLDGLNTVSVISYARDSFGMTLAAEKFGGRFYRNDTRPGGVLRTPNKLSKEAAERLKSRWESAHAGGNQHRVAVLEEGLEWQQIGITPDEAQFLGTREFQSEDVCRWFRVPPHMVGLTSKATSWGSGIEEMGIGFVTYTLRPWLTRWSQAIKRDLILAKDAYFADFVLDALLQGDIQSRYNAYAIARQWGWLSINDIRRRENMNPVPNGNAYLTPLNMSPATGGSSAHYRLLAEEAAGRLVRKEIAAMSKAWSKNSENGKAWETAVSEFYVDHVQHVAQTMRISVRMASAYCGNGRLELLQSGLEVMNDWETRRVSELAALAVNDE